MEGENFLGRLKRYLISLTVLLVDDKKNWIAPAFLKALMLVRTHKIDYVVTSGPPHSSHLIGLALKKISGVKWAADFRDPWTDVLDFKPRQARCALSDKLDRVLEKKVILGADKVFTTTEPLMNRYLERYKGAARKIRLLTNGFDAKRFSPDVKPRYARFTITYAGTLYYNRTPEPLFKSIAKLVSEKKIRPNDFAIKLIGNCASVDGRPVAEIAREYGLGNAVELPGYLSQSEVLGIMRRSHLLLVLAPNQPLAVPAKVYDCIASGTDILALTDEGGTKDLINGIKAGCCFSHSEIDDISRYIHESIKSRTTGVPARTEAHKQFDIRVITRKLSEELS
ncbi:MAG: hypothetical protein HY954_09265 [Deltaproteobacteria bacterium]|nr:hypothetical protein [Deltaproteobacteria bacterium]